MISCSVWESKSFSPAYREILDLDHGFPVVRNGDSDQE